MPELPALAAPPALVVPVLVITGTVGSGKSTVARAASLLLAEAGVGHALADLDDLGKAWPRPPEDRFNETLSYQNLACICANFLAAGADRLLIAAVFERRDDVQKVRTAVPAASPVVVRLVSPPGLVAGRLRLRHADRDDLQWHLSRSPELAAVQEQAAVGDRLVSNDGRSPREVAAEVLRAAGWLPQKSVAPAQTRSQRSPKVVRPAQRP